MAKIIHILRTTSTTSLFKEIIQETIHSNLADEFFIGSGFFQETNNYSVSSDNSSTGKSYLNNPNRNNHVINIKGVYNGYWYNQFNVFINQLRNSGYTVNHIIQHGFHAKVFISQINNIPILEIIGSSNHTSRAYGTINRFNREADIVIINNSILEKKIKDIIEKYKNDSKVLIYDYSEENQSSIETEMIWIRDNLF